MMKKLLLGAAAALAVTTVAGAAGAVTYTYVGSWHVGDGPVWTSNPAVYTGQEAAALLFGGVASDYAISTVDNLVADINFMAHVDGWADSQFLTGTVAQNYSLDTGGGGYNSNPGYQSAYSAYVLDHSCSNRYGDPAGVCDPGEPGLNYAFRVDGAVPEPATWALMLMGFGLTGLLLRSDRRRVAA